MRLYARAGLRAKALQVWDECRRALRSELDVEPCAETLAVLAQLRSAPGEPDASPRALNAAPRAPDTVPRALDAMPTINALAEPNRRDLQSLCSEHAPAAADHLLRGLSHLFLWRPASNAEARTAFEDALRVGGDEPEVLALVGWTHWFDAVGGWTRDPDRSNEMAARFARRALEVNRGRSPSPHGLQGKVLLWRMRHDAALEELRHAVTIAPGNPHTHFNLGDATMWSGNHEEAIAHVHRALALDPNDHGMFLTIEGMAWWGMRELARARDVLRSAIARNPSYPWAHAALAAVAWESGEPEVARASAAMARRHNRRLSVAFAQRVAPWRDPALCERQVRAWRAAGMPEEEGCYAG